MELTNQNSISAFDILRQRMMPPDTWTTTPASESSVRWSSRMVDAFRKHWPEYLMEATELGLFMFSACAFTILLYHPSSPLAQTIHDGVLRRLMMGTAMGSTAIAIIFSPLGKRSGAHFNPSVTWTFFRLGKIEAWDAAFYTLFQFAGGIAGVMLASFTLGKLVAHQSVNYAATLPGPHGRALAFFAEFLISFILMSDRSRGFQHETIGTVDRGDSRCSCRNLHNDRVANFGHEYEPRADVQFCSWRSYLDVTVDLFRRAASRNVAGGGSLPATERGAHSHLRKATSS